MSCRKLLATMGLFTVLAAMVGGDAAGDGLDALQGTWVVTERVIDGTAMPVEKLPEHEMVIEGTNATFYTIPTDRKIKAKFAIEVNEATTPRTIDAQLCNGRYKGQTLQGIYALEKDHLTVCLPEPGDASRPKELASQKGTLRQLIRMVRQPASQDASSK